MFILWMHTVYHNITWYGSKDAFAGSYLLISIKKIWRSNYSVSICGNALAANNAYIISCVCGVICCTPQSRILGVSKREIRDLLQNRCYARIVVFLVWLEWYSAIHQPCKINFFRIRFQTRHVVNFRAYWVGVKLVCVVSIAVVKMPTTCRHL